MPTDPFSNSSKQINYSDPVPTEVELCTFEDNKSYMVWDTNPRDVPVSLALSPIVSFRGAPVDRISVWIANVWVNTPVVVSFKAPVFLLPQPLKFCVVPSCEGAAYQNSLFYTATTTITDVAQTNGIFLCQASGILSKGFDIWMCGNTDPVVAGVAPNLPQYQVQLRVLLDNRGGGIRTFTTQQ